MERPFFSLSKSKRLKPIDYTAPDGRTWVHVSANPDYGMATIWDADILIYCASMLNDMKEARAQRDPTCAARHALRHPAQHRPPGERSVLHPAQRPR